MTCTFISTGSGVNREVWAGLDYEGRPTLTNFVESEQAFRGIQYLCEVEWTCPSNHQCDPYSGVMVR